MAEAGADCALLDEHELGQWILRRLGAPVWPVQLCEDHITDAIKNAKRWFSAKKGVQQHLLIQGMPNVTEYTLPDEVDVVLDVAFTTQKLDLSLIFLPFTLLEEKIPYDVFASGGSAGLYSSYVQTMQYVEMAKRILSAELEWRQERLKDGNKLFIAPPPKDARNMIALVKVSCFNIQRLSERDHDLIKRYALAWAMRDLGYIRTNLSEYPGAQGSVTLNGDRLLDDSKEMFEQLEEEIGLSGYPMGFLTG
jgi:hypothetical protein